jgi:hypothetical protein
MIRFFLKEDLGSPFENPAWNDESSCSISRGSGVRDTKRFARISRRAVAVLNLSRENFLIFL